MARSGPELGEEVPSATPEVASEETGEGVPAPTLCLLGAVAVLTVVLVEILALSSPTAIIATLVGSEDAIILACTARAVAPPRPLIGVVGRLLVCVHIASLIRPVAAVSLRGMLLGLGGGVGAAPLTAEVTVVLLMATPVRVATLAVTLHRAPPPVLLLLLVGAAARRGWLSDEKARVDVAAGPRAGLGDREVHAAPQRAREGAPLTVVVATDEAVLACLGEEDSTTGRVEP